MSLPEEMPGVAFNSPEVDEVGGGVPGLRMCAGWLASAALAQNGTGLDPTGDLRDPHTTLLPPSCSNVAGGDLCRG
jgi:hypothetical protein